MGHTIEPRRSIGMDRLPFGPSNLAMSAETIAKALQGCKVGQGWMARCPAHRDREPSLSIRISGDGKILVHCHAGCGQRGVIEALRFLGLWENCRPPFSPSTARAGTAKRRRSDNTKADENALAIWRSTMTAEGTLVETYLAARGLYRPLPPTIRFHAGLKHPSGGFWPAMVALVTHGSDDSPLAIHRTFLARDGLGKAPVDPQKMMLGPCRRGAVRLAPVGDVLMVGEGIETCLAAMQVTGHSAWAALSTSGLRALNLPNDVRDVIVLADGDVAGESAALVAAVRWKREGRRVRIAYPPEGMDFNDMLLGRAPRIEEGAQ
jgi:putative DNA primase/helicase